MKIITVSNKVPTQPYYCWAAFHASLKRFDQEALVLGMDQPWGGLMTKPRRLREYLRQNLDGEIMIYCDSWDLVFADDPNAVAFQFNAVRTPQQRIIWNAEKTLFPNPTFQFEETGTPYRYLNSGFAVGYDYAFLNLLEKMNLDAIPDDHVDAAGNNVGPNDQEYFQKAYCDKLVPMALDARADICQTLHGVGEEELDLSRGQIRNTVTGAYPMVFHMNGQKELWRDRILNHFALPL